MKKQKKHQVAIIDKPLKNKGIFDKIRLFSGVDFY